MKKIFFITMIMLVVQTVFAEEMDTHEVAFMEAFKKNDLTAMEKALKERTSKTNINALLATLIFWEVDDSNLPSVQLLMKYGANCNATASYLYYQTQNGLNVLYTNNEYQFRGYRNSLLAYAIHVNEYKPNLQIIKFLLESGANMYPRDIQPAEIFVLEDRRIAVTRLLIEKGYDINRSYRDIRGNDSPDNYPLGWAANYGSYAIVRLLVESGAKVNAPNWSDKKTAAQVAYEKGEIDIYNYLKQNGAVWSPPTQVASAPPPSSQPRQTYNDNYDYSPPPSSSSSSSTPSRNVGKEIADAFIPPLDSGTYGLSGTQAKIRLTGIATSGMLSYTNRQGKTVNGYYNINGNTMTVQADGFTYVYTITSKTSFSGHGETWVRTGY